MLESITTSRFFRTSKNQSKIVPVLCAALGQELVQQLSSYLDDDRVISKEEYDAQVEALNSHTPENTTDAEPSKGEGEAAGASSSGGSIPHGSPASFSAAPSSGADVDFDNDDFGEGDEGDEGGSDASESSESTEPSEPESTDVAESQKVRTPRKIMSASDRFSLSQIKLSQIVTEIRGLLNLRAETEGVSRIVYNDDKAEMWIHYNDSVNLNNILDAVLDLISVSGYYYLGFSRLARSDNAIVFDVNVAQIPTGVDGSASGK